MTTEAENEWRYTRHQMRRIDRQARLVRRLSLAVLGLLMTVLILSARIWWFSHHC